jgi:hypothetical protein
VLWLFRIPMAMSLALTRCAIAIFFIRTLYTHAFLALRRIGSYWRRNSACLCIRARTDGVLQGKVA